ncbi:hypothetical protein Mal64_03550 [Pseudobythopirellula maris]|uniref:Hydantoinase A/oxoprolinase domain-containing protein n=1 Tax=Pseudobythopirellula maris TaxID=2527991 RepID=A0A5C5ZUS2_9BACT|nr:hydantoinase/oxoprolinase family protein [Pseudobythopirellula maris]TWT89973.1 hypothetical protein Mal64_03550 [Pseudobythopirellula maris]
MSAAWLGVDVGGANLKVATADGFARSEPFDLWRRHKRLGRRLAELFAEAPTHDGYAVAMTGELADCYATKAEGVRHIVAAVVEAAGGRPVRFYGADSGWRDADAAIQATRLIAAANWRALADFAAPFVGQRPGLVIDIGSTTTDIVPVVAGKAAPAGLSDTERLLAGELVYTGVARTPLCAVTPTLPYRGAECPVAAEWFATTADAWTLLAESNAADGEKPAAISRLARCVCADTEEFGAADARAAAMRVTERQTDQVAEAIESVASRLTEAPRVAVLSGDGAFLAERACRAAGFGDETECVRLAERFGKNAARCAPAFALAQLASESASL